MNADNGPALELMLQLCLELGADAVAIFIYIGDEERAARCARRCARIARQLGLYEEGRP